jgi:hypothetical protein
MKKSEVTRIARKRAGKFGVVIFMNYPAAAPVPSDSGRAGNISFAA